MILAAATGSGPATVTVVTGILLAVAAIISSLTPVVLARRRNRKEAADAASAAAVGTGTLTLAGWTALNGALQQEIARLQGVVERMQARADLLEAEIAELRKLAVPPPRKGP